MGKLDIMKAVSKLPRLILAVLSQRNIGATSMMPRERPLRFSMSN